MNRRTHLAWLLAAAALCTGCASNWATRNEPVAFIPAVLSAIESANERPILLSDAQRDQLLQSLKDPVVRSEFTAKELLPEVWASWWLDRRSVTFVRYTEGRKSHSFVIYDPNGQIFGTGGGSSGEPPWEK